MSEARGEPKQVHLGRWALLASVGMGLAALLVNCPIIARLLVRETGE